MRSLSLQGPEDPNAWPLTFLEAGRAGAGLEVMARCHLSGTVVSDECGWRQFGLWGRMSGLPRQPYQLGIWFLDPHLSLLCVAIIKLQTL